MFRFSEASPAPNLAIVKAVVFTINRSDLVPIATSPSGAVPGLDVIGTVLVATADGSVPAAETRVMGDFSAGACR